MNKEHKIKISQLPSITLTERQLFDLEMILVGGFNPLDGFLKEKDYQSVVENTRLTDGTVWPIPIVLDVDEKDVHDEIVLRDSYNTPIAFLKVESIYTPDKEKEVLSVYGTTDMTHPGVEYILNQTKYTYIGGKIIEIQKPSHYDFSDLRLTPNQIKQKFIDEEVTKVVAFQTRNPIHRAHFEIITKAAKLVDAHPLIHPVVGPTKEGDIDYLSRVQSYRALLSTQKGISLAVLPLAMRMAGPKEALWHAIIRKNYGATHFIVGRDHAGPGKDINNKPFYGAYDAQELVKKYENEIGIQIVTFPEQLYHSVKKEYIGNDEVIEGDQNILNISGTEFRKKLLSGENIPEWFSFPEVIEALRTHTKKRGKVVLFTGLSGSGKSTLARHLKSHIETVLSKPVSFFDGDIVRTHLTEGLGFSKEDRIKNVTRIGYVASEIAKHGGIVLASLVSPYEEARQKFRSLVEPYAEYVEVYVKAPIETLRDRDTKGYYLKSDIGLMKNLTGVSDVYEIPLNADIVVDTSKGTERESVENIIRDVEWLRGA